MLKCLESSSAWEAASDDDVLLLVEAIVGRLRDVDNDVVAGAGVRCALTHASPSTRQNRVAHSLYIVLHLQRTAHRGGTG
jgi:hypothetical protein